MKPRARSSLISNVMPNLIVQRAVASPVSKLTPAGRVNSIGIAERELFQLLDVLDATEENAPGRRVSAKRKYARWNYRKASVQVKLFHPGGSEVVLMLACRNLSATGAALLHNCYIYPGTQCIITLADLFGRKHVTNATVCRCVHRSGTLHEVGVKFKKTITLRSFIDERHVENYHEIENVDPQSLSGNVMLACSAPETAKIIKHYLRETQLRLTVATTQAKAIQESAERYALLLITEEVEETTGLKLIESIREGNCETVTVLIGADANDVLASGLYGVTAVPLPFSQLQLIRRIAECIESGIIKPDEAAKRNITSQ